MSIEVLSEESLSRVTGASGSTGTLSPLFPTSPTSILTNYLIRTLERLAPGGADDGTWSQIGAAGMTA
jgi:hypothetical protein